MKESKREYSGLSIEEVKLDYDRCICNASVIATTTVITAGQEEGDTYNFASDIDFNHVWEQGTE